MTHIPAGAQGPGSAPQLAAIQQEYEQNKAAIMHASPEPLNWVHDPEAEADAEEMTGAAKHRAVEQSSEDFPAPDPAHPADDSGLRRWWRGFWTP